MGWAAGTFVRKVEVHLGGTSPRSDAPGNTPDFSAADQRIRESADRTRRVSGSSRSGHRDFPSYLHKHSGFSRASSRHLRRLLTGRRRLIPATVLSVHSSDLRSPVLPAVASRRTGLWVLVVRPAVSTRSSGGCFD